MRPSRFNPLTDAKGPFASVYVDDSHNTADAQKQSELRWRAIAEDLATQGADQELIDNVRRGLHESPPAVGRGGCAVIANHGVRLVQRLVRPPEKPSARVSELPYLVPAVVHGVDDRPYLLVVVDHQGADITTFTGGDPQTSTVDGGEYPVHKASSAESAGYGDPQRVTEAARSKNVQTVAANVVKAFDAGGPDLVFVAGEVTSRADLLSALPERVVDRVRELNAGARGSIDESALNHDIDTALRLRRVDDIDAAAQRFQAERDRASGLATEGFAGVCAALREGAVDTLIIGDLGEATLFLGDSPTTVAPTPEVLSELGSDWSSVVRADEALPFAAVSIDANLIGVDERLAPRDGIAAILRYAPRTAATS